MQSSNEMKDAQERQKEIEKQKEEYFAKGGKITKLEGFTHSPSFKIDTLLGSFGYD